MDKIGTRLINEIRIRKGVTYILNFVQFKI